MIKRNTVLVLGAGASAPYGFPLGSGLVDEICKQILETGKVTFRSPKGKTTTIAIPDLTPRLCDLGYSQIQAEEFAHQLQSARPYSVDAFLEARKEFKEIGKAAIADVLLRAEATSTIGTAHLDVDWYRYLFNKFLLLKSPDYFSAQVKRLSIITFNFDRSLEQALFLSLRSTFGVDAAVARQLTTELQIHHLHGVLGEPSFLADGDGDTTPYGPPETDVAQNVRIATKHIKIVDEEIEESVLEDAAVSLQRAEFVYFLGFGYDERNLEKLGLTQNLQGSATVRGTVYGLTEAELAPILRCFQGRKLHPYAVQSLPFLRNHAESLFD